MDKWFAPNAGPVTVKRAKISAASNAAAGNTLIAAVAGKRIHVLSAFVMAAGDVTATFYTDAADEGTALTGALSLGANGGFAWPNPPHPALAPIRTDAGEALTMLLSAAVQVSGWITYFEG